MAAKDRKPLRQKSTKPVRTTLLNVVKSMA